MAARHDFLADKDLNPAFLGEKLVVLTENSTVGAPQIDLALERRRKLHVAAIFPEVSIPLVRPIMQHDEVPHALPFEVALAVEFIDRRLIGRRVGKEPDEPN